MTTDLTVLTDGELAARMVETSAELERRRTLIEAPARMERITRNVLAAEGVNEGEEWRAPAGGHDAYPKGWKVAHNGKTWESLTPANVWEPNLSGWREVTAEGAIAAWVQPTGAHDAYPTGATVTHNGQTWSSTLDGNVWVPGEYGWAAEPTA